MKKTYNKNKEMYHIHDKSYKDYNVPYKVDNSRERDCLIFDTAG